MKTKTINEIKLNDVFQTYRGKPGCGCGCKGTYRINPAYAAEAARDRDWKINGELVPYTKAEMNMTTIAKRLAEIQAVATDYDPEPIEVTITGNLVCYAAENENRNLWIFVKREIAGTL